MIYPLWRLSEDAPDNLGLACTDYGLLLGQALLIERCNGRFVARERHEIERLLKSVFPEGLAVDRLMSGLTTVASALNANDPALARIAAVHLQIPDLPSAAARHAMIAEDALIKYARDEAAASTGIRRCIRAPASRPIPAGSRRRMAAPAITPHRGGSPRIKTIRWALMLGKRSTMNG
jgi:hypothetical protein